MALTDLIGGSALGSLALQSLLGGFTGSDSKVQKTSLQKESGAFKWVEEFLTPDMFATPDSCLIGVGAATYSANKAGGEFQLLGCCEGASFTSHGNVVTLKELRQENSLIIALKSMGGTMSLTRMLTANPSLLARIGGNSGWSFDLQKPAAKKLFGVIMIFMSPLRSSTYATLYFERCAVTSVGVMISGGSYQLNETFGFSYSRVRDVSADGSGSSTTPGSSGTNWINQVGREGGLDSLTGFDGSSVSIAAPTMTDSPITATEPVKISPTGAPSLPTITPPYQAAPTGGTSTTTSKYRGGGSLW